MAHSDIWRDPVGDSVSLTELPHTIISEDGVSSEYNLILVCVEKYAGSEGDDVVTICPTDGQWMEIYKTIGVYLEDKSRRSETT